MKLFEGKHKTIKHLNFSTESLLLELSVHLQQLQQQTRNLYLTTINKMAEQQHAVQNINNLRRENYSVLCE